MSEPILVAPLADEPIFVQHLAGGAPNVIVIENIPGPPGAISLAATTMAVTIDGQGGVIVPGMKADLPIGFDGELTGWAVLGDLAGDLEMDILLGRPFDPVPVPYSSIVAGNPPELIATDVMQGDVVGWTIALSEGDVLRYTVVSAAIVRRATVALFVERD